MHINVKSVFNMCISRRIQFTPDSKWTFSGNLFTTYYCGGISARPLREITSGNWQEHYCFRIHSK